MCIKNKENITIAMFHAVGENNKTCEANHGVLQIISYNNFLNKSFWDTSSDRPEII